MRIPLLSKNASIRDTSQLEIETGERLSPYRVILMGFLLLVVGTCGFYTLPGMIQDDAKGSRLVNSIYCAAITLTTVGYGDICPGDLAPVSKLFLIIFMFTGLGFFSGPLMDLTSTWTDLVPGGFASLTTMTIGIGVGLFTTLEGLSEVEAVYASVVSGTTIGYGDFTPKTDIGKLMIASYSILVVHVVSALLEPGRAYLEKFCLVRDVYVAKEIEQPMRSQLPAKQSSSKENVEKED